MPQNRKVVVYLYRGLQEYEHLKPVTKLSRLSIISAIDSVFKKHAGVHTQTPIPQHALETSLTRKPETLVTHLFALFYNAKIFRNEYRFPFQGIISENRRMGRPGPQ